MTKRMRPLTALVLALCMFVSMTPAHAADSVPFGLYYQADAADGNTRISAQSTDGGQYLFLPSSADLAHLTLWFDGGAIRMSAGEKSVTVSSGKEFDLTELFPVEPEDGKYAVAITRSGTAQTLLTIMQSGGIGSMYITSPDEAHGRDWVELSKENKAEGGGVTLLRTDGTSVYSGTLKNIKGRGNSSWSYAKKPYQIKLTEKVDLLETGDKDEKAKTWVLLANYIDETLIRNSVTYGLAAELGLEYSTHFKPVDLYYDGEYRGTYLLCEKTEIATGRVDVGDLEGEIEDANPDVDDFDALETKKADNSYGNTYQYVAGLTMPADISGGYLLEMDYEDRAKSEKSWFSTTGGSYIVCKSPEYLSAGAVEYISGFWQEFEDAVLNGGVNPNTGRDYREYVDLTSLAKCYLLLELSQDGDAFLSSTYFYKPAGEELLYAGPLWDFDSAYGRYGNDTGSLNDPGHLWAALNTELTRKLVEIPSFQKEVQRIYEEELNGLVTDIAASADADVQGEVLRSVPGYGRECAVSQRMNAVLWPSASYEESLEALRVFLAQRNEWLYQEVMSWDGEVDLSRNFSDVPETAWYVDAVSYVVRNGLFNGTSPTQFSPEIIMTRGMAVTVLYRLAGEPKTAESSRFQDVAASAWYGDAVAWADENGIAMGDDNGCFHPNEIVTRQEMVTFLYRWAQLEGMAAVTDVPDRYTDCDQLADWAVEAFGWAIEQEIIYGTSDTTLSPNGALHRCDGAAIFQRVAQSLEQ